MKHRTRLCLKTPRQSSSTFAITRIPTGILTRILSRTPRCRVFRQSLAGVHEQYLEIGEIMKIDATVTVHVGEAAAGAVVGTGSAAGEAVVEEEVIALVDKPVAVEVAAAVFGDVAPAKIIPRRGARTVYGPYVHVHAGRRGRVGSFRNPGIDDLIVNKHNTYC